MKTIGASKFKEQCLYLLDHLEPEGLVISKHGRPVARLLPMRTASGNNIGRLKGKVRIKGDLLKTGIRWNAQP